MKTQKWHLAGWLSAAMLTVAGSSYAAVQNLSAGVNLTSQGQVAFSASVRNISDDLAAGSLGWTGVVLNSTQWKLSDQYILLNSTVTKVGGELRIYTDNKGTGASPTYTGTSTTTVAGLIDNTDTTKSLPLAWRVVNTKIVPTAVEPNDFTNGFGWFYFTDKSAGESVSSDFAHYRTLANEGGLHAGIGVGGVQFYDPTFTSPNYVFVQGLFTAASGRNYSTNRLVIESINE